MDKDKSLVLFTAPSFKRVFVNSGWHAAMLNATVPPGVPIAFGDDEPYHGFAINRTLHKKTQMVCAKKAVICAFCCCVCFVLFCYCVRRCVTVVCAPYQTAPPCTCGATGKPLMPSGRRCTTNTV